MVVAIYFLYIVKLFVFLHPKTAKVVLSLGLGNTETERKVRAARATMLPNRKASTTVTASATEKIPPYGSR